MKTLGNIMWHAPFLGYVIAAVTFVFGALFVATVVAAPLGLGLIEYGKFLMAPFSYARVDKKDLAIEQNEAWATWSMIITILFLPFGIVDVIANVR